MSAYTKPIIRFGLVTPALFNCLLLGAVLAANHKLSEVSNLKQADYKQHLSRLAAVKNVEAEISPKRKDFEDQKIILQADPPRIFTQALDALLPKFTDLELERTAIVFPLDRGRIGKSVQADAARVKCTFEGGFGPMQEALLQVESLMPQAVLEELKITRKADALLNKTERLVFETTHICWKAEEAKR
jgi:hypothetical protein